MERRDFLKKSGIALGAAGLTTFPHVWVKDYQYAWADDDEIEVGVLYSLTGTTAIVEKQLSKVTEMAIDQINARGGVLGKKVVPIIEDPASDPRTFNEKAKQARCAGPGAVCLWFLHLGEPQGGIAGVREAQESILVSHLLRRIRVLEERHIHRRCSQPAARELRSLDYKPGLQQVLHCRVELHLPA